MAQYFDVKKAYTNNNNPFYVRVRPKITAATYLNGDEQVLDIVDDLLKKAIKEIVISTGLLWSNDRIGKVRGTFLVENIIGGDQALEANEPFLVRHLATEVLLNLFAKITQSNRHMTVFDVAWIFIFYPNEFFVGNGAPKKIPSYACSTSLSSWEHQICEGIVLNCAAFSIALKLNSSQGHEAVCAKALDLMIRNNWSDNVSFYDILNIVPTQLKEYRLTIILPSMSNHQDKTIAGPNYIYENCAGTFKPTAACLAKTIYLVYDVENRHFALTYSPLKVSTFFLYKDYQTLSRYI